MAGCWQTFSAAIPTLGLARSGWEILQTLGQRFELADFNRSDHANENRFVNKSCNLTGSDLPLVGE